MLENTIRIELAQLDNPQHQDDLLMLLDAYAQDPMGGATPLSATTKSTLIASMQQHPQVFSLLCYVDDKPAAICNCVLGFSTFKAKPLINIHDIAVLPRYRGLGLSHKLLASVEQQAIERGCCKLTLEVLHGNEVAKASYAKFGFSGYELDPTLGRAEFWEKNL
ncbi:GNAT family N-acetyltransferase [Thalassotalea ponticola]|uniref:GNAT family N-acetyltransferase n=1 Tax=Thalassotalea ponticola TaxID=1523392 RepID=UPI0025B41910|nr:GNAT family N-acetyltransferase [Thalassotalea ponticola]MDN3651629.1 GNAT family N-acetyltransferase [Thalassotalea ponticola]